MLLDLRSLLEVPAALALAAGTYASAGGDGHFVHSVPSAPGQYDVAGSDATLAKGSRLVVDGVAYTVTGTDASPLAGYTVEASAGSHALTGFDTSLLGAFRVDASPGSHLLTGTALEALAGRLLALAPDLYDLAGTDLGLHAARVLGLSSDLYALVGADSALLFGVPPGNAFFLTADVGLLQVFGDEAVLALNPGVHLEGGVYELVVRDSLLRGPGHDDLVILRRRRR